MQSGYPSLSNYPTNSGGITTRELDLITASLRDEDTLTRLSVYAANLTGDPQLRQELSSIARERLRLFDQCMTMMKQQTGFLH